MNWNFETGEKIMDDDGFTLSNNTCVIPLFASPLTLG